MGHIWLIGMMGSGKTTTGMIVAQMLEKPFIDTDSVVMGETGKTISDLFEESESVFRSAESSVIVDAAAQEDAVIATGGGSILNSDNTAIMERTGSIVFLEADAGTIADRIEVAADRPLLTEAPSIERILAERAQAYLSAARHVVSTVDRTPNEVALEVVSCVAM
jgi:shikimate kinase